jgi:hypothetical protein
MRQHPLSSETIDALEQTGQLHPKLATIMRSLEPALKAIDRRLRADAQEHEAIKIFEITEQALLEEERRLIDEVNENTEREIRAIEREAGAADLVVRSQSDELRALRQETRENTLLHRLRDAGPDDLEMVTTIADAALACGRAETLHDAVRTLRRLATAEGTDPTRPAGVLGPAREAYAKYEAEHRAAMKRLKAASPAARMARLREQAGATITKIRSGVDRVKRMRHGLL